MQSLPVAFNTDATGCLTTWSTTMANGVQYLVFAIDGGQIGWHSAHDTREKAIEHLNHLRPDETQDTTDNTEFTASDCIEFAFIVESPHFVSFV
jgi:hypothetical protein